MSFRVSFSFFQILPARGSVSVWGPVVRRAGAVLTRAAAFGAAAAVAACTVADRLAPDAVAEQDLGELQVSRSCNLGDVALDFAGSGHRPLSSPFYQLSIAPDHSRAQILNTETGCLDLIKTATGPMEIETDQTQIAQIRLSPDSERALADTYDIASSACETRLELGELRAYELLADKAAARFVATNPGVLLEAAGPCSYYMNDMQLGLRIKTASQSYVYTSFGETLIVEPIAAN